MPKPGYVYILFNQPKGTLYTGVTSNLVGRVYQHREGTLDGFTKKYNIKKLGYYEAFDDISCAIVREKQIKSGSRAKKIQLIEESNPGWRDLWWDITGQSEVY